MPSLRVRPVIPAVCALAVAALLAPAASRAAHHARQDPVKAALGNAQLQGAISAHTATGYNNIYTDAVAASNQITGNNRTQLKAAIKIIRGIAHRDSLTPGRMPFVFLVLKRNLQWWTAHHQPTAGSQGEPGAKGRTCTAPTARSARATAARSAEPTAHTARLSFPGSGIVFEYYPGMGLQLQVNGTFGNANALLHTENRQKHHQALEILDEMRPLISPRGGIDTWEYEFPFGGGVPPWASGLSQATAIEAYTTAATTHHRPKDLQLALQLSALFGRTTPTGVRVPLGNDGNWYALYSFAPGQQVLNADLDAVVALYDLAQASHDASVTALETQGLRALTRRIKSFDTGTWSRYSAHGPLADLNYHVLNRDEAKALCQRTNVTSICNAWHSFTHELDVRCPRPTKPKPKPTTPTTTTTPTPSVPQQPDPGGGVSAPTTTTTPTTPTTTTTPAQTIPTTPGGGGVGAPGG
jgi:D-glucuronyl C5-epimerase C-terminus